MKALELSNILAVVQNPQSANQNMNTIIIMATIVIIILIISTIMSNRK